MVQRVAGGSGAANQSAEQALCAVHAHRITAVALAAVVLLQAVVAGQAVFGDWEIRVHGWMGNASFGLGVLLIWSGRRARAGRVAAGTAAALVVLMVVLMVAQIGLGYAGRTSPEAASWHVPLGVAIFGLAVAHVVTATFGLQRGPAVNES